MNKYLVGTVISAALVFSQHLVAMQIPQFDKMSVRDRGLYVTSLVIGAQHALEQHGDQAKAQKLAAFFEDGSTNGGMTQFNNNLAQVRGFNQQLAADPNNKQTPYEVEHAFFATLKENGLQVPLNLLLSINKNFKPTEFSSPSVTETNKP
jgi:hypothetical protein